jgi:hypothetical protein
VTEDGIVITTGVTQEFIEAIGVAEKALGRTLSGGLGKLGRAGRGAVNFDPKAWDGDGDGIVQEGTPYSRPAIPGVNDRASGGRVDVTAATRAWQNQRRAGMASRTGRMDADDNFDEYDEAMGPPMRRAGRGMAEDPTGDAASENLDRDRNAGAVRRGLSSSTSGSRGKPEPLKREGEFHGGNIYDEFNGQYVEGEVVALSDLYGDDRPGYGIVGRYDSDGSGTVDYFYGGTDDEEFETIEDAIAFLENVENEAENDRFYNEPEFRSLDRVRTVGKPGNRPFAGLASSTASVVKIDIPQIDNAIEELAAKDIGMSLKRFRELRDEGRLPERYQKAFSDRVKVLNDIFSGLSKEKLDESPGKVLSEIRKKLVDTLSSDDKEGDGFISLFNDRREIQNFIDGIEEVLNLAFDDYVDRARENGTGEEADDLQAELLSDFTQSLKKISEKSKNLFDARTRSFRGTEPAKAKKESESEKERLFDLLKLQSGSGSVDGGTSLETTKFLRQK